MKKILALLLRALPLALLVGYVALHSLLSWKSCPPAWMEWAPALLYTTAVVISLMDERQIRAGGTSWLNGKSRMDFDVLGMFIAGLAGLASEQLPFTLLLAPLAYALSKISLWVRGRRGLQLHALPDSPSRRLTTGMQQVSLVAALWPVFSPYNVEPLALLFTLPFVGSVFWDWLLATGALTPASRRQLTQMTPWIADWLPVGIRIVATGILLYEFGGYCLSIFWFLGSRGEHWLMIMIAVVVALIQIVIMAVIASGLTGRLAPGLLLLLFLVRGLGSTGLVICYVALLYLGVGKLRLRLGRRKALSRSFGALDGAEDVARFFNRLPGERLNWLTRKWTTLMKINQPLKIILGVGTLWIVGYHLLSFVSSWVMLLSIRFPALGSAGFSSLPSYFSNRMVLGTITAAVGYALVTFYLLHVIKNTAASEVVRIILGVGIFYLPAIAMPVYYYLYILCDRPPAWALAPAFAPQMEKKGSDEESLL